MWAKQDCVRVHHSSQNGTWFQTYKLFISRIFFLIFSLWLTVDNWNHRNQSCKKGRLSTQKPKTQRTHSSCRLLCLRLNFALIASHCFLPPSPHSVPCPGPASHLSKAGGWQFLATSIAAAWSRPPVFSHLVTTPCPKRTPWCTLLSTNGVGQLPPGSCQVIPSHRTSITSALPRNENENSCSALLRGCSYHPTDSALASAVLQTHYSPSIPAAVQAQCCLQDLIFSVTQPEPVCIALVSLALAVNS